MTSPTATPVLPSDSSPRLITADAIADARGVLARPGAILLQPVAPGQLRLLAAGTPAQVLAHPAAIGAMRQDRPGHVLIPPLVNAHAHLDLTHVGPRPHNPEAGFIGFAELVRRERLTDPAAITASVARGVTLLRQAGVGLVGDIAGAVAGRPSLAATEALAAALAAEPGMRAVSFVEYFGLGPSAERVLPLLDNLLGPEPATRAGGRLRVGVQPHAPYSVGRAGYRHAADLRTRGWPVCSHVAESPEEHDFIVHARGPTLTFLERLGIWSDAARADADLSGTPVESTRRRLGDGPIPPGVIFVHLNDLSDADLARLAADRISAVYCPQSSQYFGAERLFGGHRYRDLLAAGIPVALGTDSVINLPQGVETDAGGGLSPLDEARHLYRRDGTDPATLLAMATTMGAAVLGLTSPGFDFKGPLVAGVLAVPGRGPDPLAAIMAGHGRPEWMS